MTTTEHIPFDAATLDLVRRSTILPLRGGMASSPVPIDADGRISVSIGSRHPILMLRLKRALAARALTVEPVSTPGALGPLVFAPYSEQGSWLPILIPDATDEGVAGPFSARVRATIASGDAAFAKPTPAGDAVPDEELEDWLEPVLLQGILGRILCLSTMGTQRIVRTARQVRASRSVHTARAGALDAIGADLGVPRRDAEKDGPYRDRLLLYRPWRMPTRAGLEEALNGPVDPEAPDKNQGFPDRVGVESRFEIVERDNPLMIALRVVASGNGDEPAQMLTELDALLRSTYLLDLASTPLTRWTGRARQRRRHTRATLRTALGISGSLPGEARYLAMPTALALARAFSWARTLGLTTTPTLHRAYTPAKESSTDGRFELGLACTLDRLSPDDLRTIGESLTRAESDPDAADPDVARLASWLRPADPDDDPLGRWLFEPAGLRTVEHETDDTLVLSAIPSGGLRITGPATTNAHAEYTAIFSGQHDAANPAAERAASDVPRAFANAGIDPAPARLADDELTTLLARLDAGDSGEPTEAMAGALTEVGVATGEPLADEGPTFADVVNDQIGRAYVVGYTVPRADLTGALADALATRASALYDAGFSSVRAWWDEPSGSVVFLAGVLRLPGGGTIHPEEISPLAYRWSLAPLIEAPGAGTPLAWTSQHGARVGLRARRPGLAIVACVAYMRSGDSDPYEYHVRLGADAQPLSAEQYARVMNVLDFLHPIGITVNTYDLRRRHVDIDGDGDTEWLTSRASRTYPRDRLRRPLSTETTQP